MSLHMERLAALRWRRRRLSRARRLAPAATAGWATAAAVPARPCATRSASHSSSELDEDSVARGASGAGAVGAEGPEASAGGLDSVEAAWRARATRERRSWGGGTGGQLLVAKPVTSPDSARATEPRRLEATLELRRGARGARFGRGAGERERVRVRGEEALTGRGRWSRRCGRCRSCRNQRRACDWRSSTATWAGRPHDSGEAHSDRVLERGQHWELGRELTKLIAACVCLSKRSTNKLVFLQSRERNVYRFPDHSNGTFILSQRVSPFYNWIRVWLGWLVAFCLSSNFWTQFLHPLISQGNLRRRSKWFVYIFVWWFLLQFPSEQLSGYNRLWIAFDWTLILSFEQFWCRPNTPCFDVSSMLYACTVQDAVLPSRFSQDLCVLHPKDPQARRIPSVFPCTNFVLPISILNLWWSVNWLHIQQHKCTRWNRSELTHRPVMKDQWHCVLNDLEELGDKESLLKNQYNTEIYFCFLLLLPWCSSTIHQTNVENAQNGSEDNLLFSRIQPLHLLLVVHDHDEEEYSVASTLDNRRTNNLVVKYRSKFFHQWVQFLWMRKQKYVFVVLF